MSKKKLAAIIVGVVCIIVIIVVVKILVTSQANTFNKFGLSFNYLENMEVEEKGVSLYSEEATEEAGSVLIRKPGVCLEVFWLPMEDADHLYIEDLLSAYISGRKEDHNFYLGDVIETEQDDDWALRVRFYTSGEEGILLNIAKSWYCDTSNRVFIVSCGAEWGDPVIITDGSRSMPDWPKFNQDPSYKTYKKVVSSFQCHP